MAAFRGRSLLRLGLVDLGVEVCSVTGFDCCASVSETVSAFDDFACLDGSTLDIPRTLFGSVSGGCLVRGVAIEVSGMLSFRAGMGKSWGRV